MIRPHANRNAQQVVAQIRHQPLLTPLSGPTFLTLEEVVERYRGQVSEGTLRNWRSMRIGPSFTKIGKAVLYPVEELDRWDRKSLVVCRPSRSFPLEEAAE
jgi:hypothetical protein